MPGDDDERVKIHENEEKVLHFYKTWATYIKTINMETHKSDPVYMSKKDKAKRQKKGGGSKKRKVVVLGGQVDEVFV